MTTTTAEAVPLSVGLALTHREQFAQCPLGTVVASGRSTYTKVDRGWHDMRGGTLPDSFFSLDGRNTIQSLPNEVPPVGSALTVGMAMTETVEHFNAAPLGSVIKFREPATAYYLKVRPAGQDGWLVYTTSGSIPDSAVGDERITHHASMGTFVRDGLNTLHRIGPAAPAYTGPRVGDALTTRDQYDALPVGSILAGSRTWEKINDTQVRSTDGASVTRNLSQMSTRGTITVDSLGGEVATPPRSENVEMPGLAAVNADGEAETFVQFLNRFRTVVLGAAQRAGVPVEPVQVAIRRLRVPEFRVSPGAKVYFQDHITCEALPDHTVAVLGEPGVDGYHSTATAGWTASNHWIKLLGGSNLYGVATLLTVPGVDRQAWVDAAPTDEDAESIRQFKVQAWELGRKAKSENSWCGDYETAMRLMGIDEESVTAARMLPAERIAALPVGSILRYKARNGATRWVVRDDEADNPTGTKGFAGNLTSGDWATFGLEIVREAYDHFAPMPLVSTTEMDSMPTGTTITDGSGSWNKSENGMWGREGTTATTRSRDFYLAPLRYTHIPVPGFPPPVDESNDQPF